MNKTFYHSWVLNHTPGLVTMPITLSMTLPAEMIWTQGYTSEYKKCKAIRKQTVKQTVKQTTEIKQVGRRYSGYILILICWWPQLWPKFNFIV
jgi:hypothetical protein